MSQQTHTLSADNGRRGLRCWHEWQIEGHQKCIVLCVETELEMRAGEPGFDPLALEALVLEANEMMRSCPSPIDSFRIVPVRRSY
jgi:hypothetical protein